jgi:hypothetical protein
MTIVQLCKFAKKIKSHGEFTARKLTSMKLSTKAPTPAGSTWAENVSSYLAKCPQHLAQPRHKVRAREIAVE